MESDPPATPGTDSRWPAEVESLLHCGRQAAPIPCRTCDRLTGSGLVMTAPKACVVIPAHQEQATIERCLAPLLADGAPPLHVIVAANGCRDATVERARSHGVEVLDLPSVGKSGALNAADELCNVYPRVYLDADVVLTTSSLRAVLQALDVDAPRLAVPRRRLDLGGTALIVRLYYRTWQRLQECRGDLLGTGVYAVNAAGRKRWGEFPTGIADDYHVHTRFRPHERVLVTEAETVVRPPRSLRALLGVRARVYAGNVEHAQAHGALELPTRTLAPLVRDPVALAALPTYLLVTLLAKRRARARVAGGRVDWSQDRSARGE